MTVLKESRSLQPQTETAQNKPQSFIPQVAKLFHQVLNVKSRASLGKTGTLRSGMETFEGMWMSVRTLTS